MLQGNAQLQNYWHLCGTLATAFWCFSPKNSLMQNMQLSFFSVKKTLIGNDCLLLACRLAQQTAQPLWATCSSAWLFLWWKPSLYIMFEPPRNILWPLCLFLLPRTSKKSLALSPLADAGRLPVGSPKASLFQTKKTHVPWSLLTGQVLWPWTPTDGTEDTYLQNSPRPYS